jgi:serine/threonine-protein kinase
VHRDVKPPNILLVPDAPGAPPIVKLLDFGIAKLAAEAGGMKTTVGTVLGTPAYLAPEQIMGTEVDARTDVHAVGLVLREMLVGKRLWIDAQGAELGRAIALEVPPLITRSDVPAALAALIARALEKDPRARFVDAADMRSALRAIRVVEMGGAVPEGAEQRSPDTERDPEPATVRDADDALPTRRMAPPAKARPWDSLVQVALVVIAATLGVLLAGGSEAWRAEPQVATPRPSSSLASGEPAPAGMTAQVEPRPPSTGDAEVQPDARAPEPLRRAKPVKLSSAAIPSDVPSVMLPSATLPAVPSAPSPPAVPPPSCPASERDPFNGRCPAQ